MSFDASEIKQDPPILIISSGDHAEEEKVKRSMIRDKAASVNSELPILQGIDLIASAEMENSRSYRTSTILDRSEYLARANHKENRSQSQFTIVESKNRPPQWCGLKSSESAVKRRKVDINKIRYIGELMRYRVVG